MNSRLTTYSIFHSWQTLWLLLGFFVVRIASFFLQPYPIIQAILIFILILILGASFFKNPTHAWMIVLTELFLGGSGHFLEFFGLSIRTVLLLTFLFMWIIYSLSAPRRELEQYKIPHTLFYVILPLCIFLTISVGTALFNGHPVHFIIQDILPFVFYLLLLPAYHLFTTEDIQYYVIRLVVVFIIGSALFSLITHALFVLGIAQIHDVFYTWFRDVAMGKITHVTDAFYRMVTPEHLFITPIALLISSLLMRDEKHHRMWRILFICCAIILALDFSRAYLLGFAVGLLFLKYKHSWKRWIITSLWTVSVLAITFVSLNALFSAGKSLGLEIIGIRIGSFVLPETEVSTNTRMALLDPIIHQIKLHPLLGSGLGSTLSYLNPYTHTQITTRQYDWGYLEMITELGPLGTLWMLMIIIYLVYEVIKKIHAITDYHDVYVGILAGIISLLIINITSPALFHVLGIFYLVMVMAFVTKPTAMFDNVVTLLYRVFNRIHQE